MWLSKGLARSFRITSVLCQWPRLRPCAKIFTNLRLSLPSPQVAEKLHDLAEARVLVLYPMVPQNLHKLPLIPIFENLPESRATPSLLLHSVLGEHRAPKRRVTIAFRGGRVYVPGQQLKRKRRPEYWPCFLSGNRPYRLLI